MVTIPPPPPPLDVNDESGEYGAVVPAILMLSQPINNKTIMPVKQITLHIMAMRAALFGLILRRFTMKPPATIPTHAPGIAMPPFKIKIKIIF